MTKRLRRMLWTTLGVVTILVVMAVGVFPTRQYLDQRSQSAELHSKLRYLQSENTKLAEQKHAIREDVLAQVGRPRDWTCCLANGGLRCRSFSSCTRGGAILDRPQAAIYNEIDGAE